MSSLMNKKGQGMPLNVIVIAALVLIVLLILIFVFGGGIGKFTAGLKSCSGTCEDSAQCAQTGVVGVYTKGCTDSSGTSRPGYDYCCAKAAPTG